MVLPSFGEFAMQRFVSERPELSRFPHLVSSAAFAYLFRFDQLLTSDFVQECYTSLARRVADAVGWSPEESRRVALRSFHDSSKLYFASHWDDPQLFVTANSPALLRIRREQARRLDIVLNGLGPNENAVRQVDSVSLDVLILASSERSPLVVKVYADYCSTCAAMAPTFEAAARSVYGRKQITFAAVDGPANPNTTSESLGVNISLYPTVLRFTGADSKPLSLSRPHKRTLEDFVAFAISSLDANGNEATEAVPEARLGPVVISPGTLRDAVLISADADPDPEGQVPSSQWVGMLRRQGIDELESLVRDRDIGMQRQIDDALGACPQNASCSPSDLSGSRCQVASDRAPVAILLGGGMGSGKTSSVRQLSQTNFWQERGSNVVVVEADAFKMTDPVFLSLNAIGVTSAHGVHTKSVERAEELFLLATRDRRDVIFDGTMAWCPFVEQTIAMLRDAKWEYARGPGFKEATDGSSTEIYWKRLRIRNTPVPAYIIEVIGVTVETAIAVERGIIRKILTGRGVPISKQLESHRLFSELFEHYVTLVDAATLFDMTCRSDDGVTGSGDVRRGIIASKPGLLFPRKTGDDTTFQVENREAYSRFIEKENINVSARRPAELYISAVEPRS
jgi:thiol-disulfide isomerase/thioredoxin